MRKTILLLLLAPLLFSQEPKPPAQSEPLRFGKDVVGETLPVFIDHDPDCFNQAHLQMGFVGSYSVAGCDIETKKGEVLTLAGIQITKRHAMMDRDHVVSLAYEFKHHDYPQMRAAFVKAFGPPSGVKTDTGENGGCSGERVAWKNEVSVVNLRECLDNTGGSSVAAFALLDFLTKTRPSAPQPPAQ
jgi:hypothetical protein